MPGQNITLSEPVGGVRLSESFRKEPSNCKITSKGTLQVALAIIGVLALAACAVLVLTQCNITVPHVGDPLSSLSNTMRIALAAGSGVLGVGCGVSIFLLGKQKPVKKEVETEPSVSPQQAFLGVMTEEEAMKASS